MAKLKSNRIKSRDNILDYILIVVFIFLIIITIYPFLNVLAISLNDPIDTMRNINFIIPRKFTWSNYIYVFTENSLGKAFLLSAKIPSARNSGNSSSLGRRTSGFFSSLFGRKSGDALSGSSNSVSSS